MCTMKGCVYVYVCVCVCGGNVHQGWMCDEQVCIVYRCVCVCVCVGGVMVESMLSSPEIP